MELRFDIITGLRNLFKSGATYSGLLRYLLKQHSEDEVSTELFQRYLMEAFSIPFHCGIKRNVSLEGNDDQYALIDTWFIPRVLSMRRSWATSDEGDSEHRPWWLALSLTEPEHFPTGKPSWMSDSSWSALSPTEQEKVASATTSCHVLAEEVLLMSRLAERLQRTVAELQNSQV